MNQVEKAIEKGRCALAVSGSLLRDPEVMLALSNRASLVPMALAGPAVAPVVPVSEQGVARALGGEGVVVLVEPEMADAQGLKDLGRLLSRAQNKPRVVVVSRSFNPFAFGSALQGLKVEHEKGRGKQFLQSLPEPPPADELPAPPPLAKLKKPSSDIPAPRFHFTGRDEELAELQGMLGEGGPIVVSGPRGIGKAWLVEHAIEAAGLKRLPDLTLTFGIGADTLATRLAEIARQGGSDALVELLQADHPPLALANGAVEALAGAEGCDGQVMVIRELQYALGRDADFFRKSRLEMLLEALLTHRYPLRLVFLSTSQPIFHKEGQGSALRRMELTGLKGRFLHEIFSAYKAPEIPRDRFGPINDRIHGHPLVARQFAIAVRDRPDGEKLPEDPKFLKMDGPGDLEPIKKRLQRQLDKLDRDGKHALSTLAHVSVPVDGSFLASVGIDRKVRLSLLAAGLLDMIGTENDRRYHVHRLIRSLIPYRAVTDFEAFAQVAELLHAQARKTDDPVQKMALEQEANRCAVAGRANRLRTQVPYPDQDPILESVIGMMRARNGRLDLAEQRLKEVINRDPFNADAWVLEAERLGRVNAKGEEVQAAFDRSAEAAAVPELFHQFVGYWLGRRNRNKAIAVLERGVELLPEEPRLRTRLAALLVRQGRRPEGIEHLEKAMALAPMLPDAYGLLGQARREEGDFDRAEELLREAVRLAPGDPVQTARLADLLLSLARVEPQRAQALREEARELLDEVIKGTGRDRKAPDAYLLLAELAREHAGDLERAAWLLKTARKQADRSPERQLHVAVEGALQDMAAGRLTEAEAALRKLTQRDPGQHRGFAALGLVLEAQEQLIPAFAELQRAKERAPQLSLAARLYDRHLQRIQTTIEAQAAGLAAPAAPAPAEPSEPSEPSEPTGHQRVIRRPRAEAEATFDAPPTPADPPLPEGQEAREETPRADIPPAAAPEGYEVPDTPAADATEPSGEAEPVEAREPAADAPEPSGEAEPAEAREPATEAEPESSAADEEPGPTADIPPGAAPAGHPAAPEATEADEGSAAEPTRTDA